MSRPPRFDPELEPALRALQRRIAPGLTPEMIHAQRKELAADTPSIEMLASGGAFEVWERSVPGPAGAGDIKLLFARPAGLTEPLAILYFLHGGGTVMGHRRFGVAGVLPWAAAFGLLVVSVEYRLAPENPYPAGIEDAYAGLCWVNAHAAEIDADSNRVLLAGASSGGGMAAALALLLRDRNAPRPLGQMLMYPMLDDRNDRPSTHQMVQLGMWDRSANETAWSALLGKDRDQVAPYAAASRAMDLSDLPATFLDVGTAETFRDEVIDYAARIAQAGGEVELHVWPGGFHAFDFWVPAARISQDAAAARTRWLRRLLQPVQTRAGAVLRNVVCVLRNPGRRPVNDSLAGKRVPDRKNQ